MNSCIVASTILCSLCMGAAPVRPSSELEAGESNGTRLILKAGCSGRCVDVMNVMRRARGARGRVKDGRVP